MKHWQSRRAKIQQPTEDAWISKREDIERALSVPAWFEMNALEKLGTVVIYCQDDDLTGVAIHHDTQKIRIRFGAPAEITFHANSSILDIGTDKVAHDLARRCREYFTSKLIMGMSGDRETVNKLKKRWL